LKLTISHCLFNFFQDHRNEQMANFHIY
jgi:hypothetical protein